MKTASNLKRVILPVMILIVTALPAWGQDVDSLKRKFNKCYEDEQFYTAIIIGHQLLNVTEHDSNDYLQYTIRIGDCYYRTNEYDKAIEFFSHAKDIYITNEKDKSLEYANLLIKIGYCSYYGKDCSRYNEIYFNRGISNFTLATDIYKNIQGDYCLEVAELLETIGHCHECLDEYDKEINAFLQAKDIYSHYNDSLEVARMLEVIGECYNYRLEDYNKALDFYSLVKDIYNAKHDIYNLARTLEKIGNCYYNDIKNYNEAIKNYLSAIDYYTLSQSESYYETTRIIIKIGNYYRYILKDYINAIGYYSQAKDIYLSFNDCSGVAEMLANIGNCYFDLHKYCEVEQYYSQAIELCERTKDTKGGLYIRLLKNLGLWHITQGDFSNAYTYLQKALNLEHRLNINELSRDIQLNYNKLFVS